MRSEKREFAFPEDPLPPEWVYTVGAGSLERVGPILRFLLADATAARYSDAQIDDYRGRPRRRFPWRPGIPRTRSRTRRSRRWSRPAGRWRGRGRKNEPMTNGRMTNDRMTNDRMTNERMTNDQMTNERMTNDRMTNANSDMRFAIRDWRFAISDTRFAICDTRQAR